jgi:phosphoglycerol transferase MdoB-like AlkP superfamily enzyme
VVLTLSNHAPFDLPKPLAFANTTTMGELNGRMDGMLYADWALGQFIEQAKKQDYFDRTLFVFVGDHGFHVPPVMTNVHLLYHHVPLLFYAPKLLDRGGIVLHQTSSQVNIAPSILGLLDMRIPQAFWGRDLFSTQYANENFAIFKASGGGNDVAMARGDKVLVIGENNNSRLWTFNLGFPPALTPYEDPQISERMEKELRAFVAAGIYDLANHKAGPPGGKN